VFYYIHHLYIVNIVLLYLHSENGLAMRFVTGPLVLFAADYLYRSARSYPLLSSRRARIRYIRLHPSDVVEIGFDRRELLQHTRIGQYVKLCVPELGIFQWHPFTITSTPEETKIMADGRPRRIWKVHFKVSGDWTYKLSQRLCRVTAGGDAYTNNFDQEARIGRLVDGAAGLDSVPMQCRKGENEGAYIMAIADRLDSLDSADSAIAVSPDAVYGAHQQSQQSQQPLAIAIPPAGSRISDDASPLESGGMSCVALVSNKREPDSSSFSSGRNSLDDNIWFTPDMGESQVKLPVILVDGPYSAPMETFFEYHANIVVAAGIGITPYIAALERVLDMCACNTPARTTQATREDLLPQKIYLIWIFRDISLLCVILPVLQRLRANTRARDIVVPCLYVTGPVDVAHEGTASDVFGRPMLRLSNGIRLSKGRPPVARMVSYMAGKHPNCRMGVFCCAPGELTGQVRSSAHNANAAVAHQGTSMEMRAECFSV
ncbi:hypothetical protein IWQ56_004755, partial [Coemansia nantahalensis]